MELPTDAPPVFCHHRLHRGPRVLRVDAQQVDEGIDLHVAPAVARGRDLWVCASIEIGQEGICPSPSAGQPPTIAIRLINTSLMPLRVHI